MIRIRLITTVEHARVEWLAQFVEHYVQLGVDTLHITIHFEPDVSSAIRDRAMARAAAAVGVHDVLIEAPLVCPYDAPSLRRHHDAIQARVAMPNDWMVWADIDEFQVYPGDLRELIREADDAGCVYFRGRMIDRVTPTGELAAFDPARSIWSQYPRIAAITAVIAGAPTEKVVCSRSPVQITPGNHFAVGDDLLSRHEAVVQVHHFKWDASVVARLRRRVRADWRERCPWWVESERVLRHIGRHGGRLCLKEIDAAALRPSAL